MRRKEHSDMSVLHHTSGTLSIWPVPAVPPAIVVRPYQQSDERAWDAFVYKHDHGTPFHLVAWKRVIEETYGYKALYLVACLGSEIHAILPLFLVHNLIVGRALISSPFAVYGGALCLSFEAQRLITAYVEQLGEELGVQYVELRNKHPEQRLGFTSLNRYVGFLQPIHDNNEDLLTAIPRKTRYIIRKSLKQNFETRTSSTDLFAFEKLYTANLRRLGTPCFPHCHFTRIVEYFSGMVDIREVLSNGRPAAAVLSFYFRDQVLPYYGASDPELNAQAPSSFMYFDLMCWAGRNGYRIFDFGRSKKDSGGSHDFKSHWGMEKVELPYEVLLVRRKHVPNFSPANPSFNLVVRLWRLLPLWTTRLIGPRLIRFFP